jgi:hypothetical protein
VTLVNLIRKRDTDNLATAIFAISATDGGGSGRSVARIATVAIANPEERKTASPVKVGAGDTAIASRWWLMHYPDRDSVEVACCPEATHADILEQHPDAVAAEPFTPTSRQPSAPMTASEETAIRAWLALIEETDPATLAEVVGQCQRDAARLDGFRIDDCRRHRTNLVSTRDAQRLGPIREKEKLVAAPGELVELDRVKVTQEGQQKTVKVNTALIGVMP